MMVIPVILSGGSGSRLWPVSRELHPKPFMRLADGDTLLAKAAKRAAALCSGQDVVLVTNRDLLFQTDDVMQSVLTKSMRVTYLLEPFGRNTAAAVAAAAWHIAQTHGPDAIMLILAADHLIAHADAFSEAASRAIELADEGFVATFGIEPDAPETGYGYIEHDNEKVVRFVEKPDLASAESFIASGQFVWNSGMFCAKASTMLDEFVRFAPAVIDTVSSAYDGAEQFRGERSQQWVFAAEAFATVPDISFDVAIMEKTQRARVVRCRAGWSDVGSWLAFSELTAADEQGNRAIGNAMLHESRDCFVYAGERLVGVLGVENLIVVDTEDAILVADSRRSQDVKALVSRLKKDGNEVYRHHKTVHRPWGDFTTIEESGHYKIKRLRVKPDGCLSLQRHAHRSEHWVVVTGEAEVYCDGEVTVLLPDQSTYIPARSIHRLANRSESDLVVIEVQTGSYLGEDDIERFEDIYGRA